MSKATIVRDAGFREFLEAERLKPIQRSMFTGELETLRVEVPESIPEDETVVDEGISIVKTDDIAQLVISGFGLYLGKKSLEPFAGFLHVDRPGKPSLVLDLVEEFRQPVVDRAVLSALNLGMSIRMENGQLDKASRDLVVS